MTDVLIRATAAEDQNAPVLMQFAGKHSGVLTDVLDWSDWDRQPAKAVKFESRGGWSAARITGGAARGTPRPCSSVPKVLATSGRSKPTTFWPTPQLPPG